MSRELAGDDPLTQPVFWQTERRGRDREDKPEYKVKLSVSFCFSNRVQVIEHYHNSSLAGARRQRRKRPRNPPSSPPSTHGCKPERQVHTRTESKITFNDMQDCLVLVSNNFSTQTSYENQTKKAITNKFVQEAMTDFLRSQLEVYFIENPFDAEKIAEQVLINKRSRETAEKTRLNIKKKLSGSHGHLQPGAEIRGLPHQGRVPPGALYRGGRLRPGRRASSAGTRSSRASCPSGARSSTA